MSEHDDFVNEILANTPQEWEASEGSAESIAVDYVRALEARLQAIAGDAATMPYPEDADGAPLPDAKTDPAGYARAVRGEVETPEQPNPIRTLESKGLIDQTNEEWRTSEGTCKPDEHAMISLKVPSADVPFVEQCAICGWIDAASLQWWAENAVKRSLSNRAKRIAVATETKPFAFVQTAGEELSIEEILFQALGAASNCWIGGTGSLEFDSTRARAIGEALLAEVKRFVATAERAAFRKFIQHPNEETAPAHMEPDHNLFECPNRECVDDAKAAREVFAFIRGDSDVRPSTEDPSAPTEGEA